jgi:hypothetical protein
LRLLAPPKKGDWLVVGESVSASADKAGDIMRGDACDELLGLELL